MYGIMVMPDLEKRVVLKPADLQKLAKENKNDKLVDEKGGFWICYKMKKDVWPCFRPHCGISGRLARKEDGVVDTSPVTSIDDFEICEGPTKTEGIQNS
jgi:hypothetical protein